MAENLYKKLAEGGGFSLPYLLHIYDNSRNIYVINDNADLLYKNILFKASTFNYTPNTDGSGNLEIELVEANGIIDVLEDNYEFSVDIVGVLYDGDVSEIKLHRHKHGEGTWTGKSLQLKLDKDDRLGMTFPALIFNSYNNRGNS